MQPTYKCIQFTSSIKTRHYHDRFITYFRKISKDHVKFRRIRGRRVVPNIY